MKFLKYIALLAAVAVVLNGCMEKALKDKELPPMRRRLVVYCCLVPGAPIVAELDASTPKPYNHPYQYVEPPRNYMRNAVVTLSDVHTGQSVQLVYESGIGHASDVDTFRVGHKFNFCFDNLFVVPKNQQFDILPGHEYRLTAEYEDCQPVSATTVVPTGAFAIRNLDVTLVNIDPDGCNDYHTNVVVHNQTDEPATFWVNTELQQYEEKYHDYYDTTIGAWKRVTWVRPTLNEARQSVYVQAQPDGLATGVLEHGFCGASLDSMKASVWQVNTDFMRYHSSVNSNRSDDFMIFRQADNIYTNIEGGLGIFCAYVGKELVLPNPLREK